MTACAVLVLLAAMLGLVLAGAFALVLFLVPRPRRFGHFGPLD